MRRMKKLFAVVLAVLTMSMAFAGCSSEETYISFDEVYNQLTSSIDFSASKMQKQTEAALNNYYYIDPATLENYAIYMADYATGNADEIAMFQVKESDQMTTVKSLINDRISDLKVRYEDYKPEEMPKIESAIIEEKGNYIFLVISPDNEKAQEVLPSFETQKARPEPLPQEPPACLSYLGISPRGGPDAASRTGRPTACRTPQPAYPKR